jgi:hypothetical protein
MKKLFIIVPLLLLGACNQDVARYQESGLLCEDANHNSGDAQITLDVKADNKTANIVVNGENIKLIADSQSGTDISVQYYGVNSDNEPVKLRIVFDPIVEYMLGINSGENVYGCVKK